MTAMIDESTTDDATVRTGPVPAVDLADGHLHVSERRGVTVAAVDGGLDDALARALTPALRAAVGGAEEAIVDLDQATLLDRSAVQMVLGVLAEKPVTQWCVVAGRMSSRLVLERWGLVHEVVVFGSVADALQARAFVESGYGRGWSPGA